jgi:chromosomal replication initiator protein
MELIWQKVKAVLATRIPSHAFRMWIEPLTIGGVDSQVMQLNCPNLFFKKRVMDNFGELIRSEIRRLSGGPVELDWVIAHGNHPTI